METEQPTAAKTEVLDIPSFYTTSVHVASTGNDVMLVLSAIQPTLITDEAVSAPVVAIHMSRGSAKDLADVLTRILGQIDGDLGPVDTPYAKEKREGKQ